jgi:hypothetical protein
MDWKRFNITAATSTDRMHSSRGAFDGFWNYRPLSSTYIGPMPETNKLKLLGHLLGANDPIRWSILTGTNTLATPVFRRPGRPRHNWVFLALKIAWTNFGKDPTEFVASAHCTANWLFTFTNVATKWGLCTRPLSLSFLFRFYIAYVNIEFATEISWHFLRFPFVHFCTVKNGQNLWIPTPCLCVPTARLNHVWHCKKK